MSSLYQNLKGSLLVTKCFWPAFTVPVISSPTTWPVSSLVINGQKCTKYLSLHKWGKTKTQVPAKHYNPGEAVDNSYTINNVTGNVDNKQCQFFMPFLEMFLLPDPPSHLAPLQTQILPSLQGLLHLQSLTFSLSPSPVIMLSLFLSLPSWKSFIHCNWYPVLNKIPSTGLKTGANRAEDIERN